MRDITKLRNQVGVWERLHKRLVDALELAQMDDEELAADLTRGS